MKSKARCAIAIQDGSPKIMPALTKAAIVKPFQSKVLIARVRARLRRTDDPAPEMLQIGDVSIDVAGHAVKRNGEDLAAGIPLVYLELLREAMARQGVVDHDLVLIRVLEPDRGRGEAQALARRRKSRRRELRFVDVRAKGTDLSGRHEL